MKERDLINYAVENWDFPVGVAEELMKLNWEETVTKPPTESTCAYCGNPAICADRHGVPLCRFCSEGRDPLDPHGEYHPFLLPEGGVTYYPGHGPDSGYDGSLPPGSTVDRGEAEPAKPNCGTCKDTGWHTVSYADVENGPTADPRDEYGEEPCPDCEAGYNAWYAAAEAEDLDEREFIASLVTGSCGRAEPEA
jgi:hypothetical protein